VFELCRKKIVNIDELMNRRPCDLLDLIEFAGETNTPQNREETLLYIMAKKHLEFRCKYGAVGKAREGDKFYSEYPKEFSDWLEIGFPGLDIASINSYFKKKPL